MSTTKKHAVAAARRRRSASSRSSACGGVRRRPRAADGPDSKTVTLVSHDSFAVSKDVLEGRSTKQTGYKVKVLKERRRRARPSTRRSSPRTTRRATSSSASTTPCSPARSTTACSTPYEAKGLDQVAADVPARRRTSTGSRPIDSGDICVNYDKAYFTEHKLAPPQTFDDLIKPAYKNLLVTENAATSSPGLGFLLGTVAKYGDDGWQGYWKKLKANGVKVVDGWEQAYNEEFSGSAGGKKAKADRPLVVSYASSPPAEVLYADPQPTTAPDRGRAPAPASGRSSSPGC